MSVQFSVWFKFRFYFLSELSVLVLVLCLNYHCRCHSDDSSQFLSTQIFIIVVIDKSTLMLLSVHILMCGNVSGVGKGLVGVFTRPASGVVDFASSSFEGIRRYYDICCNLLE